MAVSVRLLGSPAVRLEYGWLEVPPGKLSAILLYLACQDGWVSRDDLLYLFWPGSAERGARQNLRALLSKLRRLAYAEGLEVEPSRLRWPVETDLRAFRRACAERRWAQAVEPHGGDFLRGFALAAAPEFESWLELERSALHSTRREAVLGHAADLAGEGRHAAAAEELARLCRVDPLDETVLQRYLEALQLSGERSRALAAFAAFRESLHVELALEPEAATLRLVERIKGGEGVVASASFPSRKRLRAQATPFIGRAREKDLLRRLLANPSCRLVTLCGPGGIGKTRLALELAAEQLGFRDGVEVVPFEAVSAADFFLPALAAALNVRLVGPDLKAQLLVALQGRELLLVLDNLEHLLDAAPFIAELLAAAPGVKVLASSRARLELRAEWVLDLGGLDHPQATPEEAPGDAASLEGYDAVKLFVQAARQARTDFTADTVSLKAAARVARLVEGMPLALELAASWLRVLDVGDIAAQLEAGVDLLEAKTRDLPARHRSVRAVFEQTWTFLPPREREALRRLSVFRGGFRREAAEAVVGVRLPLLLALINKSLLRCEPSGRFSQHPLLWQFATERSLAHPEERVRTEEAHGAFFLDFLLGRARDFHTVRGRDVLDEVEADLENVEAAWRRAAQQGHETWLRRAAPSLSWFYFSRSWLERRLSIMRFAQEYVQAGGLVDGQLLSHIGASLGHQARFEESIAVLEQGLAILERHDAKAELAYHLRVLGIMYHRLGSAWYQHHVAACERALRLYRELDDAEGVTMMLHVPASYAKDPAESERLFGEAVRLARGAGLSRPLAMTFDGVAELYCYRKGDYPAASAAVDECLARFAEAGELFYRLLALGRRARILVAAGDYAAAAGQAHELLELSAGLEPRVAAQMEADAKSLLACVARLQGQEHEARTLAEASLRARRGTEALETLARLALATGRFEEAATRLDEVWAELEPWPMRGNFALAAARLSCLGLWGELAARRGDEYQATKRFREALKLAHNWSYLPVTLELLVGVASLLERRGERERALLALAAGHPASTRATKDAARRAVSARAALPPSAGYAHSDVRRVVAAFLEVPVWTRGVSHRGVVP